MKSETPFCCGRWDWLRVSSETFPNSHVYPPQAMDLTPQALISCLADTTRLRIISLLTLQGELCVCEFVSSLALPQPKISKHLAILRSHEILRSRRQGQWIHYRINQELPTWSSQVIHHLIAGCDDRSPFREDRQRLSASTSTNLCA